MHRNFTKQETEVIGRAFRNIELSLRRIDGGSTVQRWLTAVWHCKKHRGMRKTARQAFLLSCFDSGYRRSSMPLYDLWGIALDAQLAMICGASFKLWTSEIHRKHKTDVMRERSTMNRFLLAADKASRAARERHWEKASKPQ